MSDMRDMRDTRPFMQVDVFADRPGWGNPVAVVLDAQGLDEAAMQRFARWTNLSETVFLLPATQAGADYRARIFTPGGELPFAGHPTLGACHAWLAAGGRPQRARQVVQQCAHGLIEIAQGERPGGGVRLAFAAPAMQASAPSAALVAAVARALGLQARALRVSWLDNGPRWLGLLLPDAAAVHALRPDFAALAALEVGVGVAGRAAGVRAGRAGQAAAQPLLHVRAFAPAMGVPEDPVTGSLNASLAQWLMAEGELPDNYVAAQGEALGRAGRVYLRREAAGGPNDGPQGGQVWVGGDCVICIEGRVRL